MALPGEARPSKDRISALVQLLAEEALLPEEQKFTSMEIAEALWLALRIEPVAAIAQPEPALPNQTTTTEFVSASIVDAVSEPPPPLPTPKVNIATPTPKAGVLPTNALPVLLADPTMLADPLAIMRALKPLLRQVAAGSSSRLDEPATVDYIARTRLWLPILAPEQEPWFDIILVVDRGVSMELWQSLVEDLVRILLQYGAFRDLQVFDLEVDRAQPTVDTKVLLRSRQREQPQADATEPLQARADRPGRRPSELIDQRGRRLAIVLSDCTGSYWWDGTLLPMLQDWAKIMPTIVWQMLPEWMWERTALGRGAAVALSNDRPGAANQQLTVRLLEQDEPEEAAQRLSVPVVTSDVRDLTNWSLMLAGDRREVTPGFLLPQPGGAVPKARAIEDMARDRLAQNPDSGNDETLKAAIAGEIQSIARDRVQRFRSLSSPQSRRLVMLLAAAPVITLPVMRLIRDSMHEAKSPLPVAEVFLSGLLERLSDRADAEPNLVQYDFVPKVREVLLDVLPTVDTIEVINTNSLKTSYR